MGDVAELLADKADHPVYLRNLFERWEDNESVKLRLARNRNTPSDVLRELAKDMEEVLKEIADKIKMVEHFITRQANVVRLDVGSKEDSGMS